MHVVIPTIPAVAGVYKILNSANGKTYVGSTNNLARRWPEHRKKLRAGNSTCTRLQSAWRKYGEASFTFLVIETVLSPADLIAREQFWMDTLHSEYNVAPAAGSQAGVRHSAATRARLSMMAKPITLEQRQKMIAGIRGMSPEAKAAQRSRMSAAHKGHKRLLGKKQSDESRAKRSASLKGRVFSDEHRAKLRANHWRKRVAQ